MSLIGAIGLNGLVTQLNLLGSTDGLRFEAFIAQTLVPKLRLGMCVLRDNCSVHKGQAIETSLKKAGTRLIYLPPYSPDFSPIENSWSKLKSSLCSISARTYPDLPKAIEEAFDQVSLDDIGVGLLTAVTAPH